MQDGEKMATYHPRIGLSSGTQSAGSLFSEFLASRAVRKKFLLFINLSVYGIFVKTAHMD